jgi:hypothetical protein
VAALVVAVAGRTLVSRADNAGSAVEEGSCGSSFAEAVVAHSPDAFVTAWECTAGHSRGAGTHLVAAVVAAAATERRAHIGCWDMPGEASCDGGVGPWWHHFRVRGHQKSLHMCSIIRNGGWGREVN